MNEKLSFACDYAKGAHPNIMKRLEETNMIKTAGYGLDEISESARNRIRKALREKGYRLCFGSPTNQIFCIVKNEELKRLREKVDCEFWEKYDDGHTVIRFATDWGTTESETTALVDLL